MTESFTTRLAGLMLFFALLPVAGAAEAPFDSRSAFEEEIRPFLKRYCLDCHGEKLAEAQLNLAKYETSEAVADEYRQWDHVFTFVERGEMPPASADQPGAGERLRFLTMLRRLFAAEAEKMAGDPGLVLPRRLTNAEYDATVRDLTGVDLRPTASFPADPAAGEGFSNTGEALAISPSLFNKMYAAAQQVADHAVMTTSGIRFSPTAAIAFEDRKQFFEQAILRFYAKHAISAEEALTACWEYEHGGAKARGVSLEEFARERQLSSRYLTALFSLLQEKEEGPSPAAASAWLRREWKAIPNDPGSLVASGETTRAIRLLSERVRQVSETLCPAETPAIVPHAGNAPIDHLARRRKTAAERHTFDRTNLQPTRRLHLLLRELDRKPNVQLVLRVEQALPSESENEACVAIRGLRFSQDDPKSYRPDAAQRNTSVVKVLSDESRALLKSEQAKARPATIPESPDLEVLYLKASSSIVLEIPQSAFAGLRELRCYADAELLSPEKNAAIVTLNANINGQPPSVPTPEPLGLLIGADHPAVEALAASGGAFCRLFPNRFYFADETRGLSAGFHLIEGFFRDDQPLRDLVLSEAENAELDRLWEELEFVTEIWERMLRGFVFFERSERNFLKKPAFDTFKEEDPKLVEPETLVRFEQVFREQSGVKLNDDQFATHPIHIFFEQIRTGLAERQQKLQEAVPAYRRDLLELADRAYRRPLTEKERQDLETFFAEVAGQPGQGVEQAVRASIVRILTSPFVLIRLDPAPAGRTVQPLPDLALASRLSYFLWSSAPDAELRAVAESGKLSDETVLLEQTRRMLQDTRMQDFAREFFGQWLGYRDFPEQESVDRTLFTQFDDALRQSIFEEPTRFAAEWIRQDRPLRELLNSDETLVDRRLAKHYDLRFPEGSGDWRPVKGLHAQGRAGILGMAVFLTKNSQPQRTSPVKRGFWVVHKVLGEHIPAPPADVVALPAKETDTNGKTVRELLAAHVSDVKCARCHVRFDSVGLSMEGFDAIGRRRTKDLAGRPVDDLVELPNQSQARGIPDFAQYLVLHRYAEFERTFCRKLLGYALGRSLQLSDEVLLDTMQAQLAANDGRMVPLFESIVLSPQFRNQRCRDFSTTDYRKSLQGTEP